MSNLSHTITLSAWPSTNSCIDWSDESRFAIACEDGIRILIHDVSARWRNKNSLCWNKSHIPAEDLENPMNDAQNRIMSLSAEEKVEITYDPALSIHSTTGYRHVKWSPLLLSECSRCILTSITFQLRSSIWYENDKQKWCKISLTDILMKHEKYENVCKKYKTNDEYDLLRFKTNMLSTRDMSFSHAFEDKTRQHKFCYLFQSTKNGFLVIWKITSRFPCENVELLDIVKVSEELVSQIKWCRTSLTSGFLCVGDILGQVKLLPLVDNNEIIKSADTTVVWEEKDRIAPKCLSWHGQGKLLIYAKGPFLVVDRIDVKQLCGTGNKFCYCIGGATPLVDLCLDSADIMVVALLNETSVRVQLHQDTGSITELGNIKLLKEGGLQYRNNGVGLSKNAVFLSIGQSPSENFDHLTVKEPFRVELHCKLDMNQVCDYLIGTNSLRDKLDYLALLKEGLRQDLPLSSVVGSYMNNEELWSGSELNPTVLKLLRYIKLLEKSLKTPDQEKLDKEIDVLNFFIMRAYCKHLLASKFSESTSLGVIYNMITTVSNSDSAQINSDVCEICKICKENIRFTNVTSNSCINGHEFGRCSQTLLLCMNPTYRTCSLCGAVTMSENEDNASVQALLTSQCTFCDAQVT